MSQTEYIVEEEVVEEVVEKEEEVVAASESEDSDGDEPTSSPPPASSPPPTSPPPPNIFLVDSEASEEDGEIADELPSDELPSDEDEEEEEEGVAHSSSEGSSSGSSDGDDSETEKSPKKKSSSPERSRKRVVDDDDDDDDDADLPPRKLPKRKCRKKVIESDAESDDGPFSDEDGYGVYDDEDDGEARTWDIPDAVRGILTNSAGYSYAVSTSERDKCVFLSYESGDTTTRVRFNCPAPAMFPEAASGEIYIPYDVAKGRPTCVHAANFLRVANSLRFTGKRLSDGVTTVSVYEWTA